MADNKVDLKNEGVHWDLGTSQSYGEYLQLDKLLDAQKPNSIEQDEMLFIIVHQVSELWMRLFLHELGRGVRVRAARQPRSRRSRCWRASRACRKNCSARGACCRRSRRSNTPRSATPSAAHRVSSRCSTACSSSSSATRTATCIAVHKRDPAGYERLERALNAPSIYDEVLRLLSRRGYGIPEELIERDFSEPYVASKAVTAAWLGVYHNAEKDWDLYEMAERLIGSRPEVPAVALPSSEDGGARDRLQARDRRHRWCVLSRQGARAQVLPGTVAGSHLDVRRRCAFAWGEIDHIIVFCDVGARRRMR